MVPIRRRTFLERLGLTTGATILAPKVNALVSQAQGAAPDRRRLIIITFSNGGWAGSSDNGDSGSTCPANLRAEDGGAATVATKDWTMLPRYAPLERFRNKMLLVDGLSNVNGNGSHNNFDLFTAAKRAGGTDNPSDVKPGAQSLDQFVAPVLGKETPFPSVHLGALCPGPNAGLPSDRPKILPFGLFAKARNVPMSVQCSPPDAFKSIFPVGIPKSEGGAPQPRPDLKVRKRVLDFLADDVKRLQTSFAAAEREKLDQFLAAIDEAQKRTTIASQGAPTVNVTCTAPVLTPAMRPEEVFAAQIDLGTTALACGMTNVLTVSFIGDGMAFSKLFPEFGPSGIDLHKLGHNDYAPKTGMYAEATLSWWSSQVARMVERLSQIPEGDGSMLDNSVVVFAADNNEYHHAFGERVPVLLLGGAGGKLRADGRYIRYPMFGGYMTKGNGRIRATGSRGAGDLMATLGHALGVPVDKWGLAGAHPERLQGPLAELL